MIIAINSPADTLYYVRNIVAGVIITVLGNITSDKFIISPDDKHRQNASCQGGALFIKKSFKKIFEKEAEIHGYTTVRSQCLPTTTRTVENFNKDSANPVWRSRNVSRSELGIEFLTGNEGKPDFVLPKNSDFIVFEDLSLKLRKSDERVNETQHQDEEKYQLAKQRNAIVNALKRESGNFPRLLWIFNAFMPNFNKSVFWKRKDLPRVLDQSIALINADILRWNGFQISKQVSWERTLLLSAVDGEGMLT